MSDVTTAAETVNARHAGANGRRSVVESRNSDTETNASPFPQTETRTAYRVGRSGDTDTATGRPFMEFYASGKMIARFVPEKPESLDALKTVQKSMYKPWSKMRPTEIIDLHPAITITAPKGSGPRDEGRCVVRQAAFKDDLERDSDKRCRGMYACELLAAELEVTDTLPIIRQYITAPVVCDLEGAQAAIRAKAYRHERENDYWWECDVNDYSWDSISLSPEIAEKIEAAFEVHSDVDKFFPRDENNQPTVEDKPKRSYGPLWRRLNNAYANILPDEDQKDPARHNRIHEFISVKNSIKELPDEMTDDAILARFSFAAIEYKKGLKMTAPATTQIAKEEWIKLLNDHGWQNSEVVRVLNAWCTKMSQPTIEKLSQWTGTLADAEMLMIAAMEAPASVPNTSAAPETPANGNGHVEQAPSSVETGKAETGRNPFKPATFEASKLRMALVGPSGSGKTYTALKIATNMIPDARVALIDTERGSASKYAKLFKFDVLELRDYHPETYVKAINAAVANHYDVLVIDSLTHAWNGAGGILSIVDKKGGGFDKWKDVNPILWKLIDTILDSQIHVIATMRVKTDYVMEVNERTGKSTPRKVGLAPVQKEGIEYEFDIYAEIDLDSTMTISKSRCPDLTAASYPKAGAEVAAKLGKWLSAA